MRSINEGFMLNDANQVAFTGVYESGTSAPSAIWAGPVDAPQLLFSTGSALDGFPPNVRYGSTMFFSLANNGSLAQLVQLTGPTEEQALIVTVEGSNTIVTQTGGTLTGRSGELDVGTIVSISHSNAGTAFLTGPTRFSSAQTLWYFKDGIATSIAEQFDNSVDTAAQVDNTCRVFTSRFSRYDGRYGVSDGGDLIFGAYVSNYSDGPCVAGAAVIRYKDGVYTSLIKENDIVPGAPASVFTDVQLLQVTDDGTALIAANVQTPTGGARPDVKWSYWAITASGETRLVALEGEEVQVGLSSKTLSVSRNSARYMVLNEAVQIGFKLDFGNTDEVTLLGGSAHPGQPHSALAVPGAASLTYAIDRQATLPPPFADNEFFSKIGTPYIDTAGNLIFYGEVTSSVSNTLNSSSIWQIDLEGNLNQIVTAGDTVTVSGIDNVLENLLQNRRLSQPDTGNLKLNSSGAMMFRASLMSRFGSGVIVYIDPVVQ